MSVYLVSYDLRAPGRNYQPLWERLSAWKAVRALESLWIINTTSTAKDVRDDLKKYIDSNDGILVAALSGETAWQKLMGSSDRTLLALFQNS